MSDNLDAQKYLAFAQDAIWQAGRLTLAHFQTGVTEERKSNNTPVTIADTQAEQKLREMIGAYWPDHGIIGEEYGRATGQSPFTWILDPIDGTKSFVRGVPLYANLLALTYNEEPILGIANFPALDEMVYAVRGGGCYWNGRQAQVSPVSEISEGLLLVSGLNYFGDKEPAWQRLLEATYMQRTWADAYGYALVATGRAEIMIDPHMHVWDCAPFQVIMTEAGGTFTDWSGKSTIYGGNAIATNGALQEAVMDLVLQP